MFTAELMKRSIKTHPGQIWGMPFSKGLDSVYAMDDGNDTLAVVERVGPITFIKEIEIYL